MQAKPGAVLATIRLGYCQHLLSNLSSKHDLPSSVYCLATSATASAVLLRTLEFVSELSASSSFVRMAPRWGGVKVRKSSLVTAF
jgi:hypothetical protein